MPSFDANLLSAQIAHDLPGWEHMHTAGCLSLDHPNGDMILIYTNRRQWGMWGEDVEGWPQWKPQPLVYKGRGWRERMVEDILTLVRESHVQR